MNVKNPEKGKLYADGIFSGEIAFDSVGSNLFVTGEPVIGQFISDRRAVRKVEKEIKDEDGTTRKVTELEEGDFLSSFST